MFNQHFTMFSMGQLDN